MPTPSLLIVPARFKTGKLYSQIPTSGDGDFTVTRNTTATRFNSAGLIESVASGIPRLDYYTSGGVTGCPALLVEPAGTNGILQSLDTRTGWTLGANLTSGAIDVIGVSGNNLTTVTSGALLGNASILRRTGNNVALASGSTYTISFLMKKTGTHTIGGYYAAITGGAAGDLAGSFDVSGSFSSGSFFTSNSTINRVRRVERFGTDVFRCSETFTMSASGTLTQLGLSPWSGVTNGVTPAVGAEIGFAAPQIELGSVPTSFIPTAAASGSRSADVVSVSGAVSGSIGQTEGTLYAEVETRVTAGTAAKRILTISNGNDADNRISIGKQADDAFIGSILSGGVAQAAIASTTNQSGSFKIALAFKANDAVLYINGTQIGTDTSLGVPSGLNRVDFGQSAANAAQFNDRIRAAALYTTRLTNAELATLTTP